MEWIKVTGKLPETKLTGSEPDEYQESKKVLVYSKSDGIQIGQYTYGDDWAQWVDVSYDVVIELHDISHWMPLPEPPKE